MSRGSRPIALAGALLLLLATSACSAHRSAARPASQMAFGVEMAERGLWDEAAFRFEAARRLEPANARVLNNLAVAYEATGRFEEALATYRDALKLAPEDRQTKQNYSRFLEFYQAYRPKKGPEATTPDKKPGATTGG